MTFTPCKIEDIPAVTVNRSSEAKASLISFLAMETDAVKIEGVTGSTAAKQSLLSQTAKKNGLPIKVMNRKGALYLVNTAKVPGFAI